MRNYPHRILEWTEQLLKTLPSFTEAEIGVLDEKSKNSLTKKYENPVEHLVNKRKRLIASALYSVKDFSAAKFASEFPEFADIDFTIESVSLFTSILIQFLIYIFSYHMVNFLKLQVLQKLIILFSF